FEISERKTRAVRRGFVAWGARGAAAVLKHRRRTTKLPQHGEDRFNKETWNSAGISAKEAAAADHHSATDAGFGSG
ncbi:hypothetical protein, partial [Mesorhizobium sp.]|uniref:hypothetical protein n=1 Tax=Mesorhizobium sp. TaxID=1871066 RepID=UPI0025C7332C